MVGDKPTLADFALLAYNVFYAPRLLPDGVTIEDRFPAVAAWHRRLCARPSVAETIKDREEEMRKFSSTIPAFRGEKAKMEPVFPIVPIEVA
jgi:glutathione S-transferase